DRLTVLGRKAEPRFPLAHGPPLARCKVRDIFRARAPVRVARPLLCAAAHIAAVAYPEQQCALGPGDPFMQFAGRMHDKTARRHGHGLVGRAHRPAALEAEINLGRVRVTVTGARLAGLPTGDRYITLGDASEDALDMLFRIELLFALQVKTVHSSLHSSRQPRV